MSLQRSAKELLRHLLVKSGLNRLQLLARKALGRNVGHLLYPSARERFTAIYETRAWLMGRPEGSLSGLGSLLENTGSIRQQLPGILRSLGSKTLLDIGCGDFMWMKEVELPCDYIGVDIVKSVAEENARLYSSASRKFQLLDATTEPLPPADTVLCREVIFHLSFQDIRNVISNIKRAGVNYLIATNDNGTKVNADIISGDFRIVNLHKGPFFFPEPVMSIADNGVDPHRVLSVWKVSTLPGNK